MYICNAFSLQMIKSFPVNISIEEISEITFEALKPELESAIGHADTAAVLGFEPNRVNVALNKGDTIVVAQLMGGRLPEGSTTLPEGFAFKFLKVTVN
jgi:hypothetical protein